MPVREPGWWYSDDGAFAARMLDPVARVWGWAAARRISKANPYRAALPVICVGNFTAGGTGKTPLSIHIAHLLAERGERPVFLTRGYGGRLRGPHHVAVALDTAADVGDEPLLLARHAPVIVARVRVAGARCAGAEAGNSPPTVIVMDDGLQNPGLAKDLTIAVIDGRRGLGNRRVIPAGPLRAPLELQLALADAIIVNHPPGAAGPTGVAEVAAQLRDRFTGPVLEATVEADASAHDEMKGARVLALAGIANPARFHALLEQIGVEIIERASFADHHAFTEREAARVLARARRHGARIVTTEKDWVRLAGSGALAELRAAAYALPIRLALAPRDRVRLASLIDAALMQQRKV